MIARVLAALLLCLVPASAQTPGNFVPGESSGLSAHLNAQFATKADVAASAATVTATGATAARTLANHAADALNAKDFGAVCDGTTNDTAALAAAIAATGSATYEGANKTLVLPPGRCLTDAITIGTQITIEGAGSAGSVLVLRTGATTAAVTIQPAGAAFPAGSPYGSIVLRDLRIENQVIKTGSASAHGVKLVTGTWVGAVTLDNVTIYGMPGDGINSSGFLGWIDCRLCQIQNNLLSGVNAGSANDWHFYGGIIGVNGAYGMILSGSSQFVVEGTNIYSNALSNLYLFAAAGTTAGSHSFTDVMFDRSAQTGVTYDMRGLAGAAFVHCTFFAASQTTPNTYSDVLVLSAANNLATFTDSFWGNNFANDAAYTEKYALEFQGAGNTAVVGGGNMFKGGTLRTSAIAQVRWAAPANAVVDTVAGMKLTATQQFTGLFASNGTNNFATLSGFSAANDNGIFKLLSGGTARLQFTAATSQVNYLLDGMAVGSSTTPPVAGSLVFGHRQYNGTTISGLASGATDCGTSPAVVGNDNVGRITVGSGTNGAKCTFNFITTWTNAPICMVVNETSGARTVFPVPSTTQLAITAASTLTAADSLTYSCQGYQ